MFGELNYDITSRLTAIAGVRYSRERKQFNGAIQSGPTAPSPLPLIGAHTWSSATPRFSLRYGISNATNIYATFSEGFKSGGFETGNLSPVPFNPEHVNAYEVGLKTKSGPFTLNGALFYYDYKDMQVSTPVRVNGVDLGVTTNAASSHIYGLDIDTTARVTPDVTLTAGISLLHAAYVRYPDAVVQRPSGTGGNVQTEIDASGNQLIRAPHFTGTLTAAYEHDFRIGHVNLSASAYYTTRFYFDTDNRLHQPGYADLNARATWKPAGTPFEFTIWGKNLTNKDIIQSTFILAIADGVSYAAPRTFGATVGISF